MSHLRVSKKPSNSPVKSKSRLWLAQVLLLCLLSVTFAIGTLPGYFAWQWSWSDLPLVTNIHHLKSVRDVGVKLPGWRSLGIQKFQVGENIWAIQTLENAKQETFNLFFLPQEYYRQQPQVEWTDLKGLERWKTDSHQQLTFPVSGTSNQEIKANFFRAWRDKTYGVVQWYSWEQGGNANPAQWFLADQQAQLREQRVSWIAVCLKFPIDPFKDLATYRNQIKSLAQMVQASLDQEIFSK